MASYLGVGIKHNGSASGSYSINVSNTPTGYAPATDRLIVARMDDGSRWSVTGSSSPSAWDTIEPSGEREFTGSHNNTPSPGPGTLPGTWSVTRSGASKWEAIVVGFRASTIYLVAHGDWYTAPYIGAGYYCCVRSLGATVVPDLNGWTERHWAPTSATRSILVTTRYWAGGYLPFASAPGGGGGMLICYYVGGAADPDVPPPTRRPRTSVGILVARA